MPRQQQEFYGGEREELSKQRSNRLLLSQIAASALGPILTQASKKKICCRIDDILHCQDLCSWQYLKVCTSLTVNVAMIFESY